MSKVRSRLKVGVELNLKIWKLGGVEIRNGALLGIKSGQHDKVMARDKVRDLFMRRPHHLAFTISVIFCHYIQSFFHSSYEKATPHV